MRFQKYILTVLLTITSCIAVDPFVLNGRIIGGIPANISSYPYQLSLQFQKRHICGGTILSSFGAVTAAHCVFSKLIEHLSVYAGSTFYYTGGIRINISKVIIHKNYNNNTINFDIAVIKFSSVLPISYKTFPVILPIQNEIIAPGTLAVVSGWGCIQELSDFTSNELQIVHVRIVNRQTCQSLYIGKGNVTVHMLCAGTRQGGRDACQGDSGGPLTVNGKLIGIVSWGYGCARPGYPGVYTRVPKFINWIKRCLINSV